MLDSQGKTGSRGDREILEFLENEEKKENQGLLGDQVRAYTEVQNMVHSTSHKNKYYSI